MLRNHPDTRRACGLHSHGLWESYTDPDGDSYGNSYSNADSYGYGNCDRTAAANAHAKAAGHATTTSVARTGSEKIIID